MSIERFSGGVELQVLAVGVAEQIYAAPKAAVVVVSGENDDNVGFFRLIDYEITARMRDCEAAEQEESSSDEELDWEAS